jgi:hypothetical protein
MKSLALLAFALFAGCAVNEPATSSATSAASNPPPIGPDATQSEDWQAGKQTIDDLWPITSPAITSMRILTRKGPDRGDGTKTFLAVVVWNHTTVGHVYWVNRGSVGADFSNLRDNTLATRCNSNPDNGGGQDGAPVAGPTPTPHPNVNGPYLAFDPTFLQNAKDAAAAVDTWTGPQSVFVTYADTY